ncbi:MAG TPA: hypothetical protein VE967_02710 [Gemmatimonadaceae bacterium]|nr:hypothetical protein [Gemmatimonadaceae bacterium]
MKLALIVALIAAARTGVAAQSNVAVREIGRLERVSTPPFQSVSKVLAMPDGRVLVNDGRGRRLVMLDSTLSRETVIADTMGANADEYARGSGEILFRFRGDSALLVNISTLVGLVVGPDGKVARVLAFPPPPGHPVGQQVVMGGRGDGPGIDARGRLVYFSDGGGTGFGIMMLPLGFKIDSAAMATMPGLARTVHQTDSLPIWRVDLTTRHFDTLTVIKVPMFRTNLKTDASGGLTAIELVPDLLPTVDDFVTLRDGTIAVVRGRDYHIDWFDGSGRMTSTPKMPFAWERLSDERRNAIADSAVKEMQAQFDRNANANTGRGGRASPVARAPNVAVRPSAAAMPEYVPAFVRGDVRGDAEGNVWIRTSTKIKDRPVYDVVNRKGELFDRVQLPAFRVIAGFAPGVVFMAVQDSSNVVRIERARIH